MFITSRKINHYTSIKSNIKAVKHDNYSPREPPNSTGMVDWWTTSQVILRNLNITVIICYPSGIFVQVVKINKHKYISYLTIITWDSWGSKAETQVYNVKHFNESNFSITNNKFSNAQINNMKMITWIKKYHLKTSSIIRHYSIRCPGHSWPWARLIHQFYTL